MEPDNNDFHFSFFKPTSESARHNRNMVVQFVLIWAVAIFGFQILLKVFEKPTPEPAYLIYQSYWPQVESGENSINALKNLSQSALSVLGKGTITQIHREALDNFVSWAAINIASGDTESDLLQKLLEFERVATSTEDIGSEDYVAARNQLVPVLQGIFGLTPGDVRGKIAPLEVKSSLMETFDESQMNIFRDAMDFYLVHNGSFLTEARFLGFPFHYFYTAFLLLVLFVGLCWLYCVRTDMFNKRFGIED